MKIGFFTDIYYPYLNGVSVAVDNLIRELRKKGHTVYLFAPQIKDYKDNDPDIFRLSSTGVIFSAPEIRLPIPIPNKNLRKVFALDLDLIHAHGSGTFSLLGYQIARIKGIPFILTFHGMLTEYMHYLFKGKILKPGFAIGASRMFGNVSDGITTPSEKMKDILLGYGIKKPVMVIPNVIDTLAFNISRKTFLQKKLHLPENTPIILAVGRLGKEKNFSFIVKMFKKLAEKESTPHLVFVGKGPEKENLVNLSGELIDKRIHFADEIDAKFMPFVYASAEIFVFASTTEVHPMVVLEAAAAGLPLVLLDDSAYKNIIINGVNGFSLPQKQDIFVTKLKQLLGNKTLAKKFGKNSQLILRKNFDPEFLTNEMVDYYKKIIKEYKPDNIKKFYKKARALNKTAQAIDRFFNI